MGWWDGRMEEKLMVESKVLEFYYEVLGKLLVFYLMRSKVYVNKIIYKIMVIDIYD